MIFPEAGWLFAQICFTDNAAVHALVADVLQVAVLTPLGDRADLCHPVSLFNWFVCHIRPRPTGAGNLHGLKVLLCTLGELVAQTLSEVDLSKKAILYPGRWVLFAALPQHDEGVNDAQVDQKPEEAAPVPVLRDSCQGVAGQQLLADVNSSHVLLQETERHGAADGVQFTHFGLRPSPNSVWFTWSCIS